MAVEYRPTAIYEMEGVAKLPETLMYRLERDTDKACEYNFLSKKFLKG